MLQNYLKIALRSLLRQKSYSAINIVGLAVGLACTLLIGVHIADDLSFDRFHTKGDRIVRFVVASEKSQMPEMSAPAWADALKENISQIEATVRFYEDYTEKLMSVGETKFYEKDLKFADPNVFDVFDFPLVQGNPQTALTEPYTIVLSESAAKRYFGNENPMGKTIRHDNKRDLKVTGVMRDIPSNSHLQCSMLGSMETVKRDFSMPDGFKSFFWSPFRTYLLLHKNASVQDIKPLLQKVKEQVMDKDIPVTPDVQPLREIHLVQEGALKSVYFLVAVALVILFIACINYTNLATARSLTRIREVGVRKTLGASRHQLATQFFGETLMLTAAAFAVALALAELASPLFSELTGKKVSLFSGRGVNTGFVALGAFAVFLLVSFGAGFYPALFLSRFSPSGILRGITNVAASGKTSKGRIRAALVVAQFTLSVVMIVATLVVQAQLSFIQTKELGFNREQVVLLQMRGEDDYKAMETLKQAFRNVQGVLGASISNAVPGKSNVMTRMPIEFKYLPSGDKDPNIKWLCIDESFLPMYRIPVVEGRNLNASESDEQGAFLLNEAAVRKLKWEQNPLGREIGYSVGEQSTNWHIEKHGRVVGVVKDFHVGTLHREIEPLLIHVYKQFSGTISVKLQNGDPSASLAALEAAWKRVVPNRPFEYTFLDDDFNAVYKREMRLRSIVGVFAGLAIFVSCLGLLGLAAFTTEQRTKEIGIRKVLGASVASIITLLSTDFLKLVVVAVILATPLAYWAAGKWLQDFAYRVELQWWLFALAGASAVVIAFITVASQAWRAARANPVNALRSE
jgi:putative ABC transport system permease protein